MAVKRRYVKVDGATGNILSQDAGPGNFSVVKNSNEFTVTFPEAMVNVTDFVIFVSAILANNVTNTSDVFWGTAHSITATTCIVETYFSSNNDASTSFVMELIGDVA